MTVATSLSGVSKLASMDQMGSLVRLTDGIGNEFSVQLVHECTDCTCWLVKWIENGVSMAGRIELDKACDSDEGRIWFVSASAENLLRHNEWHGDDMYIFETVESQVGYKWKKSVVVEVAI